MCQGLTTEEEVEVAADEGFDCSLCRTHGGSSYGTDLSSFYLKLQGFTGTVEHSCVCFTGISEALGPYIPQITSRTREPGQSDSTIQTSDVKLQIFDPSQFYDEMFVCRSKDVYSGRSVSDRVGSVSPAVPGPASDLTPEVSQVKPPPRSSSGECRGSQSDELIPVCRCKPKLKLRIINQNSVSVLQTPDHDPPMEPDHSRGQSVIQLNSASSAKCQITINVISRHFKDAIQSKPIQTSYNVQIQ